MIGSARQSSNIRPPRRVCTVAAGEVGCRVDSARRTNQKRSTVQVLRGGSKNILPSRGVHAPPCISAYFKMALPLLRFEDVTKAEMAVATVDPNKVYRVPTRTKTAFEASDGVGDP